MGFQTRPQESQGDAKNASRRSRDGFRLARTRMVERLVEEGFATPTVAEALLHVPRHELVPEAFAHRAYDDSSLPIGEGQTISAPSIVAMMTTALELRGAECVLEIGTGSAYQTALLARLADRVVSIERVPRLASRARRALDRLGVTNAIVHLGDGTEGRAQGAPYDAIVVTAGGPEIPEPLRQQLAAGGRLVGPFGARGQQQLVRLTRSKSGGPETTGFHEEDLGACRFVDLLGKHGW